jgi:Tol biopolymer transport system component
VPRTLQPEDRIAHFRVVGPLGAGGMGEVYIAQDQSLERSVALKVLPPNLVKNEERVRRFVTEAKSASSLSHPHIVTIYEIGHDHVRTGEGDEVDPGSDPVHYISMELVTGETLQNKIHHEKTDLRPLLGYLVQAAEGLAKAHASGIVHRDLKPSNIMISRDGYAKVLDFGLAKLIEREGSGEDATSAATEIADRTGRGAVLGTVGYMSPEQVRAKSVDHRSDIFSFGCILYEAATRTRPFVADSDVETMHHILHQQPEAVEQISPETPNALRRLIGRCLQKNPDQRLQSMKDLAIELQEIVDEFDSLASAGGTGSATSAAAAATVVRRGRISLAVAIGIVAVSFAGLGLGFWALSRRVGGERDAPSSTVSGPPPFQTMTMTSLVSAERIAFPALSADGRYLTYVSGPVAERSLWVRQIATGSQVRAAGPLRSLSSTTISPDGNYVFFRSRDPETPLYSAIFSVPSLGGTPRKRIFDVDTAVTHSPDGKRVAFRRGLPQFGQDNLVVVDLDTGEERVLASLDHLPGYQDMAWSPDGERIAATVLHLAGGLRVELVSYRADTGEPERVEQPEIFPDEIAWLPDGRTLAAIGRRARVVSDPQVWLVEFPGGRTQRVTNDLNEYSDISVGEDGRAIAAIRKTITANLWTVPADGSTAPRQITFGAGSAEAILGVNIAPDGALIFGRDEADWAHIWSMRPDGSESRPLTTGATINFDPLVEGGPVVFGRAGEDMVPHLWRIDLDGGNPIQLTHGTGEVPKAISPDGKVVIFARTEEFDRLWAVPVSGGEARPVTDGSSIQGGVGFSPDGRRFLCGRREETEGGRLVSALAIVPAEGGDPVATLREPPGAGDFEWAPDGSALTFCRAVDGVGNVYRFSPGNPEPVALTSFREGRDLSHEWSPDGSRMLVQRRIGSGSELWVVRMPDGRPAGPDDVTRLASFATGSIYRQDWMPDGASVVFSYGSESRDVVAIRDFR